MSTGDDADPAMNERGGRSDSGSWHPQVATEHVGEGTEGVHAALDCGCNVGADRRQALSAGVALEAPTDLLAQLGHSQGSLGREAGSLGAYVARCADGFERCPVDAISRTTGGGRVGREVVFDDPVVAGEEVSYEAAREPGAPLLTVDRSQARRIASGRSDLGREGRLGRCPARAALSRHSVPGAAEGGHRRVEDLADLDALDRGAREAGATRDAARGFVLDSRGRVVTLGQTGPECSGLLTPLGGDLFLAGGLGRYAPLGPVLDGLRRRQERVVRASPDQTIEFSDLEHQPLDFSGLGRHPDTDLLLRWEQVRATLRHVRHPIMLPCVSQITCSRALSGRKGSPSECCDGAFTPGRSGGGSRTTLGDSTQMESPSGRYPLHRRCIVPPCAVTPVWWGAECIPAAEDRWSSTKRAGSTTLHEISQRCHYAISKERG